MATAHPFRPAFLTWIRGANAGTAEPILPFSIWIDVGSPVLRRTATTVAQEQPVIAYRLQPALEMAFVHPYMDLGPEWISDVPRLETFTTRGYRLCAPRFW
jgi:hypothetical protein